MLIVRREDLKRDFPKLITMIQENHEMGEEIFRELFVRNKPVKGLCTQRGYFVMFGPYYFQYFMDHLIMDAATMEIGRSIQKIIFYDDFVEYESERVKTLSTGRDAKGLNLN
jgi:hypothetical protein